MKVIKYILLLVLLVYLSTGCAPPSTYVVDVVYTPELKEKPTTKIEEIQIAVIPFEDGRTDKEIIGTRKRLLGQTDRFTSRPAPVTVASTQAVVTALKIHGYQTKVLQKGTEAESITQSPPHIVISGTIEELWADAQSKPGYTDIKASVRLKVKVYKVDEKTGYTVNIQSQAEPRVIFFTPSAMQNTINETLTEAINRLVAHQLK